MKQFLFCSTVFFKKQYTVMEFEKENVVEKLHYLLTHREDAVIWPLFVKSDIEELVSMDPSLSKVLKGIEVGSDTCKIKYNGLIYEVDEITLCRDIKHFWKCITNKGNRILDPSCIEFVGSAGSPKSTLLAEGGKGFANTKH